MTRTERQSDTEPRMRPSAGSRFLRFCTETLVLLVVAVVVAALLRMFVVQAFYVPSGSMEPTIGLNERIVVSKIGGIHRGDVIVFEDPGGWLSPEEMPDKRTGPVSKALEFIGLLPPSDKGYLVKRLIGLPGDHVACCDSQGRMTVNGVALDESGYLYPGNAPSETPFDVIVPKGRVWVMGDHRANSGDSRPHLASGNAFVPERLVVGRALAAVWPPQEIHWLGRPDTFANIPDPNRPAPEHPVVDESPNSDAGGPP